MIFKDLFLSTKELENRKTIQLYEEVRARYRTSPCAEIDPDDLAAGITVQAFEWADQLEEPSRAMVHAVYRGVHDLIDYDELLGFRELKLSRPISMEEGADLRNYLRDREWFLSDWDTHLSDWGEVAVNLFGGILTDIPETLRSIAESDADETFTIPLVNLMDEPAMSIENTLAVFISKKGPSTTLFRSLREHLWHNIYVASGRGRGETKRKPLLYPTEDKTRTPTELADAYFSGTPLREIFHTPIPFAIPAAARFEHCHIVGGTGHGKTQLLQHLIHHDLLQAREGNASVVVIDSQGDLINTISHLDYFNPAAENSLAERLMLIDPNDIEHPAALNMFDVNMERMESYSLVEREKLLNSAVELYEYIFGALLGAELTQKQGVIFRYLARLMLVIPHATVQTLLEIMEDGRPYKPYMAELQRTSRKFFETQFFHPSFNATKSQIVRRLWGVLSNSTFERMFSNPENKLDLFEAMNDGKIILINTAKDLLKQEGCEIFGRFFIAMISQAALERATIAPENRMPTFVYIDEAQDYLDERCEQLFNQARKYKVGLTVAHQNLGQLGEKLKQSIMASTSTKLAGGVSDKDARAFASEMRCSPDFIHETRKRENHTEFACWVKHVTPQAIKVSVPLGSVERLPVIPDAEYQALIEANRRRYCTTLAELERQAEIRATVQEYVEVADEVTEEVLTEEAPPVPPEPEERKPETRKRKRKKPEQAEEPPLTGHGGKEHKYLQNILKQIAQDYGYHATIEQEILDGDGLVDLSLKRDGVRIACEISVTTGSKHELANIGKALAAGYEEVILVSSNPKHLRGLERAIKENLSEEDEKRVLFLNPESLIAHLDELDAKEETREETVRGYKVTTTHARLDPAEAEAKRKSVAKVIAGSLKNMKDEPRDHPEI